MLVEKTPIDEQVRQYDELRRQQDIIKGQMERLAANIKSHAEKHGAKDDKGSFICDSGDFIFGKQARKTVKFIQDAACKFFIENGLSQAVETINQVKEDAVEKLIGDGSISFEELESITEMKVIYAILVKPKEEAAEAEQAEIKSNLKKPFLFKKG
jgi:hypothetical protein